MGNLASVTTRQIDSIGVKVTENNSNNNSVLLKNSHKIDVKTTNSNGNLLQKYRVNTIDTKKCRTFRLLKGAVAAQFTQLVLAVQLCVGLVRVAEVRVW